MLLKGIRKSIGNEKLAKTFLDPWILRPLMFKVVFVTMIGAVLNFRVYLSIGSVECAKVVRGFFD